MVIKHAHSLPEVTKISPGIIKHVGGGRKEIKFDSIVGGILAKVRGSGAVQEIYIYTSHPSLTMEALKENFK